MLFRLYEPILWRSLKVANPMVRRNSAMILVDAFPLQDPDNSYEEMDVLLQKQFDSLQSMIQDPCSGVRQVGIEGVCHIFARFWELIPANVLNDFLNQLVNDLAYDATYSKIIILLAY
jgi:condensin-2 complex subunit G2